MRVAGAIRFLVNFMDLQLECVRVLHEILLVAVHMYGSETMLWKEKDRSRVRAIQMDNLRWLLDIRRMNRVSNAWIRELCREKKDLEERSDESVLWWFGNEERMEKGRIAKKVYVGECAGSGSVGRQQKRWIDIVKDCLRKRGLDVRREWCRVGVNGWGLCEGECMERSPRDKALEGWKSVCGQTNNVKGIKEKIFCFHCLKIFLSIIVTCSVA